MAATGWLELSSGLAGVGLSIGLEKDLQVQVYKGKTSVGTRATSSTNCRLTIHQGSPSVARSSAPMYSCSAATPASSTTQDAQANAKAL